MRAWPLEPRRRILVEYVLIAGVNDREDQAWHLARLLSGLEVKINVIPLNEDPTYLPGWRRPDEAAIEALREDPRRRATGRSPSGAARDRTRRAACGQLKGRTVDPRKKP